MRAGRERVEEGVEERERGAQGEKKEWEVVVREIEKRLVGKG